MDLSTTRRRVSLHSILSYIFLPLSLLLNVLVFVLSSKTTKLGATQKLIHAFCGVCVLLSIAHAISVAHWEHLPHAVAFFPTGELATLDYLTPIAFQLQQVAYISIICLIGYMYIHRYRIMLASTQRGDRRWKIVLAIIIAAILQWESICLFIMKPNDKLRTKFNDAFAESYGMNFMNLHFLAVDLEEPLDPWMIFNVLGVLIEASMLICLIIWCGFRIQFLITRSISSEKAKRIQRRVLRLLIFQAIHPLLIFELPSFINFFQLMLNVQFSATTNLLLVICIAVFPVTNPLLTLLLSREISAPLRVFLRIDNAHSRSGLPIHTSLPSVVSKAPHMPL